jgi:hypothetical protein
MPLIRMEDAIRDAFRSFIDVPHFGIEYQVGNHVLSVLEGGLQAVVTILTTG